MHPTIAFSVLFFFQVSLINCNEICAANEDLLKCSCNNLLNSCTCRHFMDPTELQANAASLINSSMETFEIEDCIMLYLPKDMFINFHIKRLVLYKSTILGLETDDGSRMFAGLERSLESLTISSITGLSSWRWKALSVLDNLKDLFMYNCDMDSISEELPTMKSLTEIRLDHNGIQYLHKYAFKNLLNLKKFHLTNNRIKDIYREVLPNPANKLEMIGLSYNRIEAIPDNFFINMPHLTKVFMNGNKIKFLSYEMFQPLAHRQRFSIDLEDNNIICCSYLMFLIEAPYKYWLKATCNQPLGLRGRKIINLKLNDINKAKC